MSDLTREQILVMEAGPEMNAAVAEHVKGWRQCETDRRLFFVEGLTLPLSVVTDFDPSHDIAAAMEVVDKAFPPDKCGVTLTRTLIGWEVSRDEVDYDADGESQGSSGYYLSLAGTLALACCRAALLTTIKETT